MRLASGHPVTAARGSGRWQGGAGRVARCSGEVIADDLQITSSQPATFEG